MTDPAAVQGLALSVAYRGGLIVSVNGKELKREHIAPAAALAEGPAGEERTLPNLPIPAELLRKGMNLIGLEVVRAGYPEEDRGRHLRGQLLRDPPGAADFGGFSGADSQRRASAGIPGVECRRHGGGLHRGLRRRGGSRCAR